MHAYIIGEHGDSEIPLWSLANIGGRQASGIRAAVETRPYDQVEMNNLFLEVRDAAYEIIKRKGATYYAIGLGLLSIVESIIGDHRSVMSVSTLMTGQYGVREICLSLPCVVGANGIEEVLTLNLSPEEEMGFRRSAEKLLATLDSLPTGPAMGEKRDETPNSILANQYVNPNNRESHYVTTGPEIWEQTGGSVA